MAFRRKMKRSHSRRNFSKNAMKIRKRNHAKPMRGGYRI